MSEVVVEVPLDLLREAYGIIKVLAEDLTAEINDRYEDLLDYPAMRRKYDRDLAPVLEADEIAAKLRGFLGANANG